MTVASLTTASTAAFQSQLTKVVEALVKQASAEIAQKSTRSDPNRQTGLTEKTGLNQNTALSQNEGAKRVAESIKAPMDILNQQSLSKQLLNQPLAIKALADTNNNNIQALASVKVFEAKVLSSTLLRNPSANTTTAKTSDGSQQYQIKIAVGTQQYQLISKAPIDQGTHIQLKLQSSNNINTVTIVNLLDQPSTTNKAATQNSTLLSTKNTVAVTTNNNSTLKQNLPNALLKTPNTPSSTVTINGVSSEAGNKISGNAQLGAQASKNQPSNVLQSSTAANISSQNTGTTNSVTLLTETQKTAMNQAIRQALPLQQPMNKIVANLQQLTPQLLTQVQGQSQAQAKEKLLNQIQNAVQGNIQSPTQNRTQGEIQLQQNTQILQRVLKLIQQFPKPENLQQPAQLKQFIQNSGVSFEKNLAKLLLENRSTQPNQLIDKDSKALLLQLNGLLKNHSPLKSNEAIKEAQAKPVTEQSLTYSAKPDLLATENIKSSVSQVSTENNLDLILKQLSRLIFSSLARTQLYQLETLASRQGGSPEAPMQPANNLVLELPIINGKHVDNLELQIQYEENQTDNKNENNNEKLWTVVLNFDLHSLGKLHAQLKVLGTSVAAVLWAENKDTHDEVNQHIKELKKSFEEIGVKVKQLDVKLGTPPEQASPLQRQLVDIRT